jgi:small subunit ribosomal protein S7e
MFNRRDKIIKKAGEKPTDLEEEVAKTLGQLKVDDKSQEASLSIIFINGVSNVEYEQADGSSAQYLLVRIPHRSHGAFKKVGSLVQEHLEKKYQKPVLVVANRTIISPGAKHHPSQMRPRSRTLTAVNLEILNDVCFPSNITGKSIRVTLDGKKHEKVQLDPLDKDNMENKIDAIMHCYHKLTTHKIALGFSKPNSFQQKILAQRNKDSK